MIDKIKSDIKNYKFLLIIIFVYILLMQVLFKEICPIKIIFNTECPGCGLTHATISLIKGDILKAFKYNYSVFFWCIFFIIFILDRYFYKMKKETLLFCFIITYVITIFRYILLFLCQKI